MGFLLCPVVLSRAKRGKPVGFKEMGEKVCLWRVSCSSLSGSSSYHIFLIIIILSYIFDHHHFNIIVAGIYSLHCNSTSMKQYNSYVIDMIESWHQCCHYISHHLYSWNHFREKQEIIDSLGDPDHDYISFFVCRNPVAKLVKQILFLSRSLGALRAPTSRWRPFGPFDFVLRALRALRPCDPRVGDW